MKTVVLGEPPEALTDLIALRKLRGLDTFDEVWEGTYHMAPAPRFRHALLDHTVAVLLAPLAQVAGLVGSGPFNLGSKDDYRVPDGGYHRESGDSIYLESAAILVEILSPDDETYEKFAFYASHDVDEIIVVDPDNNRVRIFTLADSAYVETSRSLLLAVETAALTAAIDWP